MKVYRCRADTKTEVIIATMYENKNVKQLYGFQFGLMVVGEFITLIAVLLFVTAFLPTHQENKSLFLVVGGLFAAAGFMLLGVNLYQMYLIGRVESLSGITSKEIDIESRGDNTEWFENTHVLTTENMIVGFTSDIGNRKFGQTAFRYNELKRIYGYNAKHKELGGLPSKGRYRIVVIASDDKEYTLSEIQSNGYANANVIEEMNGIYEECKKRIPELPYGPENMKSRKYTFPYYVLMAGEPDHWYEGGDAALLLSDDIRKDVAESFEADNLIYGYSDKDAIVKTSMKLLSDGNAEVTISYFGDREEDISDLGGYLEELFGVWGNGMEYDDRMVFFQKEWIKDSKAKKVEN